MIITLIGVVPGVRFDATCTVIHSPSSLVFFAYGNVSFPDLLYHFSHCYSILYSVAFVSFETILFVLTLVKFLAALRDGWGRTSVVYLLVRDGTWAFMLIFGLSLYLLCHFHFSHFLAPPSDPLRQRRFLSWRGRLGHRSHRIPVVALDRVICRRAHRA